MITATENYERFCPHCSRTCVHEVRMTGTSDRRRIVVILTCLGCRKAKGRIV